MSLMMPSLAAAQPRPTITTLAPLAAPSADATDMLKRTRLPKRPARVAVCNDSTGHEALQALERRLKTMRLNHCRPSRPTRPVQLAALPQPPAAAGGERRSSEDSPSTTASPSAAMPQQPQAVAPGMTPRRPRFMKPLLAAPVPPTPARGPVATLSPRRPVSASLPQRRPAPSILKRRRRTRSATTRRATAQVAARDTFVPEGMIVSLPPLLPTHSLLADAYTQGYDCGVVGADDVDDDMASLGEIDTDTESDMALSGSLGGSNTSYDRPSVAVPSSFVHDMLASLDDSLEEGAFRDLLASARNAQTSPLMSAARASSPHIPEDVPLNDSPTLILDALTPAAGWHHPRSPTGFPNMSLDASFAEIADLCCVSPVPAPPTFL